MEQGGIISSALGLIKEKEKQGDKAMERLHDGFKTQMELTAPKGSWTGDQKNSVVKEKVVEKEKVKEPEKEQPEEEQPAAQPAAQEEDDDKKDDVSGMGIIAMAQGASK